MHYQSFLAHVECEKARSTFESYANVLRQFAKVFPDPLQVSAEQVSAFLARPAGERPRAQTTKRKEHIALRALYRFLHEQYGAANVMRAVKTPKRPRRVRPKALSRQEIGQVLSVIRQPQQRTIVLLMADAGLRVSEACQLPPSNITLQGPRRHLRVLGKGDVERLVPIGDRLALRLREEIARAKEQGWYDENKPLCRTATGAAWNKDKVYNFIAEAGIRAGMGDIHSHRLRHGYACHLYFERNTPLVIVSRLLGHASTLVTEDYLGVKEAQLYDAIGDFFD